MEPINSSDTNLEAPRSHRGAEKIRADDPRVNAITQRIIGVAIEVHQVLGPGLLEPTYQKAMGIEFTDAGIKYEEQLRIPAYYKGRKLGEYCIDFLVEDFVIVEVKSVERMNRVFEAQILTYLRVMEKPVGLLINFNSRLLKEGVDRFAL